MHKIYSYTISLENPNWVTIYTNKKVIVRTIEGKEIAEKIIIALQHGEKENV